MENSRGNDLDDALARTIAVRAWHHCDHVFKTLGADSGFDSLPEFQNHVRGECPELSWLQDLCNETKHREISRYAPNIDAARQHDSAFSREFSRDFDISFGELILPDGQEVWFLDAAERTLEFWSRFFEENGI